MYKMPPARRHSISLSQRRYSNLEHAALFHSHRIKIRTKLRAYTPPAPPAPLPTVAPVVAVPKKVNPIPAPKRKGSENEILVDGEDDGEEGEVRPIAKSASISSSQEKRPRREHSWQKQGAYSTHV